MRTRSIATTLILFSLSPLFADDILPPQKQRDSLQGMEAPRMVAPSSRFEVENGFNFFLNAEFLWWVAKPDGLYFAESKVGSPTTANPPDGAQNFYGHLQKVQPHWDAGCRVGIGGNMPYDDWDIFFNWTFYETDKKNSKHGNLLVLWGHPDAAGTNLASFASAKWNIELNMFDAELGRSLWIGDYLSFRPFIGARGAWIDQNFKIFYDYATTPIMQGRLKLDSSVQAGGIRAGADTRFNLLHGWSIISKGSYSVLYGHFDSDFREKANSHRIASSKDGFHQGISTLQLSLGIEWDTYFCNNRYHAALYAAWEQNIWFGLEKWAHFSGPLSAGTFEQTSTNLSLQGGTFGARLDF